MKENKKYEILKNDFIVILNHPLYRIRALRDFSNIKEGDIGGYIEKEDNLSQEGDSWIYNDAKVYDNAKIYDNAKVYDNASIFSDVKIYENAKISNATINNNAEVYGNARVYGGAFVYGNAKIYDNAEVCGNNICVYGNAEVYGDSLITGRTYICNNAYISSNEDYISIGPIGSRDDYTTFFIDKNKNIYVRCGCFSGSIEEFESKVLKTYKDNEKFREEYLMSINIAKVKLG